MIFKTKRKIQSLISTNYDKKTTLQNLSKTIQNKFNFKSVSININAENEVFLRLSKHELKLVVKYGKERIFTKEHKLIDTNNYSTEGLPVLTGLSPKEKSNRIFKRQEYLSIHE